MKINSFIIFVIIFFFNSGSAESLAYLDMTSVYNNSLVGKSIKVNINKFKDELINDLKKKEKLFIGNRDLRESIEVESELYHAF